MIDGIHFFKAKKTDTLAIIKKHCTELLRIQDDEEWNCFYDAQAASLEAKPYPTLEAIQNVFALALKRDPEIKNFNPLALWDLHYLREIDDSGYINRLYALTTARHNFYNKCEITPDNAKGETRETTIQRVHSVKK